MSDSQRNQFEKYICTRPLMTKYSASLVRARDGVQYKDVRVQGHWMTWQAAVKCCGEQRDPTLFTPSYYP